MGKGGEDAILPGPCSSCGDRGGGGLQGGWKGPVRERGRTRGAPSTLKSCGPRGEGAVSSPSLGGTLGVLPACPLHSSPPHRGAPPTASLRTLESQTASQMFPWHLKSRTGVHAPLLADDV